MSILDSSVEIIAEVNGKTTTCSTRKSFVQQRAERLYGPGALAQGFYKRSSSSRLNVSSNSSLSELNSSNISSSSCNTSTEIDSFNSLPVLRHLNPEFRAQLPVVNTRRPTDGSEQMMKSLQRCVFLSTSKPFFF